MALGSEAYPARLRVVAGPRNNIRQAVHTQV